MYSGGYYELNQHITFSFVRLRKHVRNIPANNLELPALVQGLEQEVGEDGWRPWERSVLEHLETVEE